MIYFIVAQNDEDGSWTLFGPKERIEEADKLVASLSDDPRYSQVYLSRVLTEEDGPDAKEWQEADKPVKLDQYFTTGYPDHWPKRYNACTEPCDMLEGICACGSWHDRWEDWAQEMIATYGMKRGQIDFPI